ncbi:unnamed protein product [Pleuronectes platessa]|uniref:DDT domain-containing protein n=1 Tax=Pleuronectes platessa TaxID=8262 RepID=A0A9N7UWC8_PLEPL|nr:unnamed protein product [Pleuronectes platessa]
MDGRRSRRLKSEHQPSGDGAGGQRWRNHPRHVGENNFQDLNNAKLRRKREAQGQAESIASEPTEPRLDDQAEPELVSAYVSASDVSISDVSASDVSMSDISTSVVSASEQPAARLDGKHPSWLWQGAWLALGATDETHLQSIATHHPPHKGLVFPPLQCRIIHCSTNLLVTLRSTTLLGFIPDHPASQHPADPTCSCVHINKLCSSFNYFPVCVCFGETERLKWRNKERELQLRRLELEKAKALKEPIEDMCLADLKVLQFLHTFGKVLGLDNLNDLDLSVPQEGLLNTGGSMEKVQDLLVSMQQTMSRPRRARLFSSALPPGCSDRAHISPRQSVGSVVRQVKSKTLLGEDLSNVEINRDNVSEILQIYMEAHSYQTEFAPLALSLRTRAFQAHSPSQKVSMLTFLVNGLTWSKAVHSEINKNMDHMTNLWKDKWAVEDKLRKLWSIHTKRTEQRDSSVGGDDSKDQAYEEEEEDSRAEIREEEDNSVNSASVEELEKQIEKLCMQQNQITKKLLHSHSQPSLMIGQDRYMRRYWLLPGCGGVFVEGIMSSEGYEELKETQETAQVTRIKEEQLEEPIPKEMLHGWWRVSDVQELHSLVEALHSRGIRENALQNQFQENMEYLTLLYANSKDAFDVAKLEKVTEKTVESWCVEEQAMEVDISQQQPVEALERRVVSAGPQIKGWMHPEPQSEREDLVYQEHKLLSSPASWNAWTRETSPEKLPDSVVRRPNNPLDIAVMRLAELEGNVDRRSEEEVTPGMSLWHKAPREVRSSAQLLLCIQQLQKSFNWDRPVMKVVRTSSRDSEITHSQMVKIRLDSARQFKDSSDQEKHTEHIWR